MIFAKTPQGQAEMAQRSILIMLGGHKRLSAFGMLLPEQEVAAIVVVLLAFQA